jgi:hypothetical protein
MKFDCEKAPGCYVLITIENKRMTNGHFVIQATETIRELKFNEIQKIYQEKDDLQFFHLSNPNDNVTVYVIVSTHGTPCHKISISQGVDPYEKTTESESGTDVFSF